MSSSETPAIVRTVGVDTTDAVDDPRVAELQRLRRTVELLELDLAVARRDLETRNSQLEATRELLAEREAKLEQTNDWAAFLATELEQQQERITELETQAKQREARHEQILERYETLLDEQRENRGVLARLRDWF